MKRIVFIVFFLVIQVSLIGQVRPEKWAKVVDSEHLENFYQVDDKLFRSANPDPNGFRELESMGIVEILNLRNYHSDDDESKGTNVKLYRVKMNAHYIKEKDVVEALQIIKDIDGKVLVHCKHGSDRTGLIVAMYRIVFQNWTKAEATDELINGGYGFHTIFHNIPKFIDKVDVTRIKKAVMQ